MAGCSVVAESRSRRRRGARLRQPLRQSTIGPGRSLVGGSAVRPRSRKRGDPPRAAPRPARPSVPRTQPECRRVRKYVGWRHRPDRHGSMRSFIPIAFDFLRNTPRSSASMMAMNRRKHPIPKVATMSSTAAQSFSQGAPEVPQEKWDSLESPGINRPDEATAVKVKLSGAVARSL